MEFLYNQAQSSLLAFAEKNMDSKYLDRFKVGYPQPKSLLRHGKVGIYK